MSKEQKHRVTINDVARECGVSNATVSRVLNNTGYIKESTRERVLAAVDKLGYVVNQQARSLAGGKSKLIGLIILEYFGSFMGEIARVTELELLNHGYDIAIFPTNADPQREREQIERTMTGLVDGLIVILSGPQEHYLNLLRDRGVPFVLVGSDRSSQSQAVIGYANWQGGYDATAHLIELGHRRIGFLHGPTGRQSAESRYQGYCAALRDAGIPYDEHLIDTANFQQADGFAAANRLLALDEPPTAFFATNDASAIGAMQAVRNLGLNVPRDISIVGFDDVRESTITSPQLTTIHAPVEQLAREAVWALIDLINDPNTPPRTVTLGTHLVIRESTAQLDTSPVD